ncbi:hypothetical protein CEXT_467481 [Caerostris extrusa]|uniref:Uncharacterized protein n=1 Tax=Caerostris extrusa TaxID=172846 RepID=A0AAV4WUE3_CAEEX|nr:hypothetical protein CEXT_467481 [Caerostris extrusa]
MKSCLFPEQCYNCQVPLPFFDIPIDNGEISEDLSYLDLTCCNCKHPHFVDANNIRLLECILSPDEDHNAGYTETETLWRFIEIEHDEYLLNIQTKYEEILQNIKTEYEEYLLNIQTEYEEILQNNKTEYEEILPNIKTEYEEILLNIKNLHKILKLKMKL